MQGPGDLARLVRLERRFLEGADTHHGAVELGEALQIVSGARAGPAFCHRPLPLRNGDAFRQSHRVSLAEHQAACAKNQADRPSEKATLPLSNASIALDSVTHIVPEHRGLAAFCASHGGAYSGYYAARMGIGGIILNDAGVGREEAGLGGVRLLEALGVPAATISHRSARIGDGVDGLARGVLSFANAPARSLGLVPCMPCREALQRLASARLAPSPAPPEQDEHRTEVEAAGRGRVKVIVMDSNSLVTEEDSGHVVVSGSHGGILGGKPATAVKYPVFAIVTNDADRGMDDAGVSRLPALEARGIAGACVSAFSARIGDGRSIYEDGYISALNAVARRRGGNIGQTCRAFVAAMVEARIKDPT